MKMTQSKSLSLEVIDKLEKTLVEEKIITASQLQKAKEFSKESQKHLGSVLISLGYATEETLAEFLSSQLDIPHVDLEDYDIDPNVIPLVSAEIAHRYRLIPLFKIEDVITIAMADPLDLLALDRITFETGHKIRPLICSEKSVLEAIKRFYPRIDRLTGIVDMIKSHTVKIEDEERLSRFELERMAEDAPVVKFVNALVDQAIQSEASDIHIEPQRDGVSIRFRIDGVLHKLPSLPKSVCLPVISRIKILAGLDITQRRKPQDGRISFEHKEKRLDLRISVYPAIFGAKIVIRILDLSKAHLKLQDLGMPIDTKDRFSELIQDPNGIILVTGPTGSGKTTTLYAALNSINSQTINIVSIEDPVEYSLENVIQGNVDEKFGLTFASALRSILRQDPDVILVGEIRDTETAQLAIRAALTGHLVFSTLHTNDAVGAITRLLNLGVEPFLISSSLQCVLAQRLVRVICTRCKYSYSPQEDVLKSLNLEKEEKVDFYRGKGCEACDNTGYKGRAGVYELLIPNEEICEMIMTEAPAMQIKKVLSKSGTRTLRDDGLRKVMEGVTTIDEVIRLTTA